MESLIDVVCITLSRRANVLMFPFLRSVTKIYDLEQLAIELNESIKIEQDMDKGKGIQTQYAQLIAYSGSA